MVLFNLVSRNVYHKNGTQWIGKICARIIGEPAYDSIRLNKRLMYAKFWYAKQKFLCQFQTQFGAIAQWFSLLNKTDTSKGFPIGRQYERHQDFAVFNVNHEGWFQLYFVIAGVVVILWNWQLLAVNWNIRGETVEDQELYRMKDARVTTNFDRTKYKYNYSFMGTHYNAVTRRSLNDKDHPDNPRVTLIIYIILAKLDGSI